MPIIPWRPFGNLDRFFEELDPEEWSERPRWGRMLSAVRSPRMDIYEDKGNIIAEAELPGVDPKNIEVEVKDNILMIEAKSEEKKEVKEKGYYRKETGARYFKRQVPLPAEVAGEKAVAEYEEGVLKITIPKAAPKKVKKNKIKIKIK